jgi:hypothetical protein
MNTTLEKSLYHSFLRVAGCVCALVLVFDSGLLLKDTSYLSKIVQRQVASVVGVSLGVQPTEMNQLTARITELETELEAKERLIAVNIRNGEANSGMDTSTFVLSIIVFILLVLIVLNYALDYLRSRPQKKSYEPSRQQLV